MTDRIASLEQALTQLTERVTTLEGKLETAPSVPALSPEDIALAETLRTRAGGPYEVEDMRGAVAYGGAIEIGEREYLFEVERPAPGLARLPMKRIASILGVLASPQRLTLLTALLPGPKSSNELQSALGVASPGQLYHHLKELLAAGIVEQNRRKQYRLAIRHLVPFMTVLAAAVDLGMTPKAGA